MKAQMIAIAVLVLVLGCATSGKKYSEVERTQSELEARVEEIEAREQSEPRVDIDYILALSAADCYLHAWTHRDWDNGSFFLSKKYREAIDIEEWKIHFVGVSSPRNMAFEISNGKRLFDGRIQFDYWIYYYLRGDEEVLNRPLPKKIILIEEDGKAWRVDYDHLRNWYEDNR